MEERRNIVYIGIDHIHTHPENPRKDLGDLTELAESMKKQGCWEPPAWSIKVSRPGRIAMQDR